MRTIREKYGDLADDFLTLYPSSDMGESILATTRDALYGWTSERLVRSQTAMGHPSYLYLFDHGYPAMDQAGLHAFHASELPYVFGTLDRTPPLWPKIPDEESEKRLSDAMISYWMSFAKSAVPSSGGAVWPAYDAHGFYMAFSNEAVPTTGLLPGMFELHEDAMCRRRASGDVAWNWNTGLMSPTLGGGGCSKHGNP